MPEQNSELSNMYDENDIFYIALGVRRCFGNTSEGLEIDLCR